MISNTDKPPEKSLSQMLDAHSSKSEIQRANRDTRLIKNFHPLRINWQPIVGPISWVITIHRYLLLVYIGWETSSCGKSSSRRVVIQLERPIGWTLLLLYMAERCALLDCAPESGYC